MAAGPPGSFIALRRFEGAARSKVTAAEGADRVLRYRPCREAITKLSPSLGLLDSHAKAETIIVRISHLKVW